MLPVRRRGADRSSITGALPAPSHARGRIAAGPVDHFIFGRRTSPFFWSSWNFARDSEIIFSALL